MCFLSKPWAYTTGRLSLVGTVSRYISIEFFRRSAGRSVLCDKFNRVQAINLIAMYTKRPFF